MIKDDQTINIIHIDAPAEKVWETIATPAGSNSYQSDACYTTGNPNHPEKGDKFHYFYGDIENHSICLESKRPHLFKMSDEYKSMLPDGTIIPYFLETTYKLREFNSFTELTVHINGYKDGEIDKWIQESMEHSWRRALFNLKSVIELGQDLRNEFFGYPRIGVTNTTVNDHHADCTDIKPGDGVIILEAFLDGPAYNSGLRAGDVILSINNERVRNYRDIVTVLSGYYKKSAKNLIIEYSRFNKIHETTLDLSYNERFTGLVDTTNSNDLAKLRQERQSYRAKQFSK